MHFSSLILFLIFPALFANIVLAIPLDARDSDNSGNAYTGTGGQAPGGSDSGLGGLINIFSDNAGDGGSARSGSATGRFSRGRGDNSGNAYTGTGGNSPGGSVTGDHSGSLVNIFSGNAGSGGNSDSGNAGSGDGDCGC